MLTTSAVHDLNLDLAVGELLQNARRLAASGFATVAREALGLLLQQGPWRVPAHGLMVQHLQQLLPVVSLLAGEPCPTVGDQASIPRAQLPDWAVQEAGERLRSLACKEADQQRAAGEDWSPSFLSTLADRQGPSEDPWPHFAFGRFCVDAEFVLKARIGERFGISNAFAGMPSTEALRALSLSGEMALLLEQLEGAGRIDIAPAAKAVDTADIARATAGYLRATGFAGGHLARNIFLASWLQLVEEGRDADAVEVATLWLAHDEDAPALMLHLAPVPSAGRFLEAAKLAGALQIDMQAAHGWLTVVRSRTMSESGAPMSCNPPTASRLSRSGFLALLQGTPLEALEWLQVPVPGSDERAWIASVPVEARKELWHRARALTERTAHWPVITTLWSTVNGPPDVAQLSEDLFMRSPYHQGALRDDISPQSFIDTSRELDVDAFLAQLAERDAPLEEKDQLQVWRDELERLGIFPDEFEQAWAACTGDRMRFERWLADREAAQGQVDPEHGRQPDYEPDNAWLVLLPTTHGEDVLAYMHWWGTERGTVDGFIALIRRWRTMYGAELVAHYGTMLEFVVRQPATDLDTALALAREHELAAPCTFYLPGISLRHYAVGMLNHGKWFLHERP